MRYSDFLPPSENGLFPAEAAPGIPVDEYDPDRIVVFYNPASSNSAVGQQQIAELKASQYSAKIHTVPTSDRGNEANQDLFRHTLKEGDILALATGDGTIKLALQTLVDKELPKAIRHTPIVPLGAGRGNDLDVMLNDSRHRVCPSDILESGRIVEIVPGQASLSSTRGEYTHIFASYVSFGATAAAAMQLNRPEYRGSFLRKVPGFKTLHEQSAVLEALYKAPLAQLEQDDETHTFYDLVVANGPRMAGGVVHFPVRLTDRYMFRSEIIDKQPATLARSLGSLALGRQAGKFQSNDFAFITKSTTHVQFDGEAEPIYPETSVVISPAELTFRAVTTRVRP